MIEEGDNDFGSTRPGRILYRESNEFSHIFVIVQEGADKSDFFIPDHLTFRVSVDDLGMDIRIPLLHSHLVIGAIFKPHKLFCPDIYQDLLKIWVSGGRSLELEGRQQLNSNRFVHFAIILFVQYLAANIGTSAVDQSVLLQIFSRSEAFSQVDAWTALEIMGHVVVNSESSQTGSFASSGLHCLLQIPSKVLDLELKRSDERGNSHDVIHVHAGLKFLLEKQLGTPFPLFSGVMPLMRRLQRMEPTYWDGIRYTTSVDLEYQGLCAWRDDMEAALEKICEVPADTILNSITAAGGAVTEYLVLSESKPVTDLRASLEGATTQVGVIINGLALKVQTLREERVVWEIALAVCHGVVTHDEAISRYCCPLIELISWL